ncbi:hypothetical protein [Polaribacter sp. AHE13PA]|uniref:hypothetical protein n=1 Tax=Polaribacter sp. AHE13PA TaxID=2745562 RepID=UPI001C4EFF91|nr:hypothetical protein [Polaribacter sp. AHE13PA]QXP66562.1 hypothetical protein H0I28_15570 [Polaribacter sp. AHE13PA]
MIVYRFMFKKKKRLFNNEDWFSKRESRYYLVEDLIKRKLILQMTKKDVIKFLGDEFNDINCNIWTFYLGKKYLINFKERKLNIIFGDKGKVKQVLIK